MPIFLPVVCWQKSMQAQISFKLNIASIWISYVITCCAWLTSAFSSAPTSSSVSVRIASARSARWMNKNLFGVHIPEPIVTRLEQAKDSKAEGRKICVELIQELTGMDGVSGAHLMAPHGEQAAAAVIRECGVLENRVA